MAAKANKKNDPIRIGLGIAGFIGAISLLYKFNILDAPKPKEPTYNVDDENLRVWNFAIPAPFSGGQTEWPFDAETFAKYINPQITGSGSTKIPMLVVDVFENMNEDELKDLHNIYVKLFNENLLDAYNHGLLMLHDPSLSSADFGNRINRIRWALQDKLYGWE